VFHFFLLFFKDDSAFPFFFPSATGLTDFLEEKFSVDFSSSPMLFADIEVGFPLIICAPPSPFRIFVPNVTFFFSSSAKRLASFFSDGFSHILLTQRIGASPFPFPAFFPPSIVLFPPPSRVAAPSLPFPIDFPPVEIRRALPFFPPRLSSYL